MKNQKWPYLVFSFIATLFILPFIYIVKYVHFAGDDLCRVPADFNNYFGNVTFWYLNITGRYTNGFISYLPLYDLRTNRLILKGLFVVFGFILYLFVRNAFIFFHIKISKLKCVFITLFFFIALISQLPSVYEFFYWYASTTVYLVSVIFFLLFLIFIFNFKGKPNEVFLICLWIILLNGNNEMFISITNLILFGFLIENIFIKKIIDPKLLLLNVISWLSSLAVIFAPGNFNRQDFYTGGGDLVSSFKLAILSSGKFTAKSLLELPYIFLYLGLFLFLLVEIRKRKIHTYRFIHPLLLISFSLILLASVIFVPYYATGYVQINDGRIGNLIHIVLLILLFINTLNSVVYFNEKIRLEKLRNIRKISLGLFSVFLLLIPFTNPNYLNLYYDFKNGDFVKYNQDIQVREEKLKSSNLGELRLERIKGSRTIKHLEISKDSTQWENQCYTSYINEKYNLNIRTITVE